MNYYIRSIDFLISLILVKHPLLSAVTFPLDLKTAASLEQMLPKAEGKERVDILNDISFS